MSNGFWIGACCSFAFYTAVGAITKPSASESDPTWFQRNECSNVKDNYGTRTKECTLKLSPRKMTLEFMSRDQFDAISPAPGATYTVGGFARVDKSPCEIVIPIDAAELTSTPNTVGGNVHWTGKNYSIESSLAHEILHCYAGRWHSDYVPGIQFRQRYDLHKWSQNYEIANGTMFEKLDAKTSWTIGLHYYNKGAINSSLLIAVK